MVRVSVSETYDLSTQTNKMSLIGVHTPDTTLIQKTYPGLCMNAKYCKILSQDVAIACASMEPADPLQVGVSAGDIAPEDLFNPILYKAVSNASMSQIEARIHGLSFSSSETPAIEGHQAIVDNDDVTTLADEFPVYYALLSNRDGFKAANPQQGLQMTGLVPLVYERLDLVGTWNDNNTTAGWNRFTSIGMTKEGDTDALTTLGADIKSVRGNAKPMPRFPTTVITGTEPGISSPVQGTNWLHNGMGDGSPGNFQIRMPVLNPVFTACIIIPPSRLHKLFYRMVIRTHLEFSEVRPIQEVSGFTGLANRYAPEVYYSDYEDLSKRFATDRLTQVDAANVDIKKIMEGS